ncbi:MAG: hypothetical protein JSU96_16195 [Acidobacteriota bacterium]|nr:MAG: hypothetical protein JSU96_16195 [Acidobacteriota bacterium]
MRVSDLIPTQVRERIPAIGSDAKTALRDTQVYVRLYDRRSSWNWYVLEFDGERTCFGLIVGRATAVAGQFSLEELLNLGSGGGGPDDGDILLDSEFLPQTVADLALVHPQVNDVLSEPAPRELHAAEGLVSLEE